MPVRGSPWLIAAYHVLHRLSAPRHPPDTLMTLDRSHYRCPPSWRVRRPAKEQGTDARTRLAAGPKVRRRGGPKRPLLHIPNLSGTGAVKLPVIRAPLRSIEVGTRTAFFRSSERRSAAGVDPSVGPRAGLRPSRVPTRSAGHIHSSRCRTTGALPKGAAPRARRQAGGEFLGCGRGVGAGSLEPSAPPRR